jgi:hypothetical protein
MQKDEKKITLQTHTIPKEAKSTPPLSSARLKILAAKKLDQSVELASSDGSLNPASSDDLARGFVLNVVSSAISRIT